MTTPDRLEPVAEAVLDGAAVDWNALEAFADAESRRAIQQLRLLERLAHLHREAEPCAYVRPAAPDAGRSSGNMRTRWGHLEILGVLGRGAHGTVYRAWDPGLDREVALKLLAAPSPNADRGRGIIEEGRMLARVRHTNVVTVHGAAEIDDQVGLWMELVQGETLEGLLEGEHRFNASETARIGLELCGAVAAVHAAGLLHRDVKAHNVVRAEGGRVVLMDLGAGSEAGVVADDLAGTPLYLAPEVLQGGDATVQSDVYALGVLLYHLLTNAYPVSGRSIDELRDAHAAGLRAPLRQVGSDVPSALARVINRAIDPVPSRRYRNIGAMAAALAAAQRRRPWRTIAVAAAVISLAVAAWTTAERGPSASGPRVAVLAFTGTGDGDPTLTRGLAQEIQRNLAGLDGLVLLASSSGLPHSDPVDAGLGLDADFVIDGGTFRSGSMLRVNARLVRVADAHLAWSGTYDRSIEDVFTILDDISRAIAEELRVTLRLPRRHDIGLDVYYEFLRGQEMQSHRGVDQLRRAADVFEGVVARAPGYAAAWAGIATSLTDAARLQDVPPPPRVKEAAQRAIQLDEFQAEAQQAMGNLFAASAQWREADAAFLRALDVNPSRTFTYTEFVLSSLLPQRRLAEALRYLNEAERRDPRSLDVRRVKALVLVEAERYSEAIDTIRWVLARDQQYPFANLWYGRALALSGRPDEALKYYGEQPGTEAYRGYALAVLGRRHEAERLAAALAAEPHRQMLIYGGLADRRRAFEALERVVAQNHWRAATWIIRPEVAILREDPRYGIVRERLGLPHEPSGWWAGALRPLRLLEPATHLLPR